MSRKQKSVYDRIINVENKIQTKENELTELKNQLKELLQEKDDLEMKQVWAIVKDKGLSVEDIQNLLNK